MGPGVVYASLTFLAGVLALLGWLYATAANPRSGALLGKSLLLFALPIMLIPAKYFQFPLAMWAWVACEEGLKAFGATRERRPADKFWLVILFGVWELALDKPFWGFAIAQSGESWGRLEIVATVCATALPVLMHAVTAAIYAFTFERRLWAAFIISWLVHTAYNEGVEYFPLSAATALINAVALGAILILIIRHASKSGATKSA